MWPRTHRKAQNPQSGGWGSHSGHRPSAGHTPPCMPGLSSKALSAAGTGRAPSGGGDGTSIQLSLSTGGLLRSLQTLPPAPSTSVSSSLFYTLLSTPFSRVLLSISLSSLSALPSILNFLSSYQYRLPVWICPSVPTSLSISPSLLSFPVSLCALAMFPLPSPSLTGLLSSLRTLSALVRLMANTGHARRG